MRTAGTRGVPTWMAVIALALACSAGDPADEARFAAHGSNAMSDTRTGLEWTPGDGGRELAWPEADAHCRALDSGSLGAGTQWRLPTIGELASLYEPSTAKPCGEGMSCRIDGAIPLTTPYQWSATAPQPDRRFYFDFALGTKLSPIIRPALTRGTLCVRRAG